MTTVADYVAVIDINRTDDELLDLCAQRGVAFVPFFAIAGARREAGAARDHDAAVPVGGHADGCHRPVIGQTHVHE
jgi:hypothetical protein